MEGRKINNIFVSVAQDLSMCIPLLLLNKGVGLGGGGQGIVVVTVSLTVPLTSSLVGRSSLRTILWLLERRTMNLTRT